MFVNTLRVYKRLKFSLRLEKNFDHRLVGHVLILHLGDIHLTILFLGDFNGNTAINMFEVFIHIRPTSAC